MDQYPCPYCTNQIPTHSKKCSHCHEWLKPGNWHYRNPEYGLFYIVLLTCIFTFGSNYIVDIFMKGTPNSSQKKFEKEFSKINITSNKVIRNGKRLYISGEAKNDDKVNWSNVYITATYFNKAGERIDGSSDVIQLKAGETQDYQIEFYHFDKSDPNLYNSYKVEVTSATDYGR